VLPQKLQALPSLQHNTPRVSTFLPTFSSPLEVARVKGRASFERIALFKKLVQWCTVHYEICIELVLELLETSEDTRVSLVVVLKYKKQKTKNKKQKTKNKKQKQVPDLCIKVLFSLLQRIQKHTHTKAL
jgi:hypothetical protein